MPAVQTNYGDAHVSAFAGMIANLEVTNTISRTVETAAIGFGKAAKQGAADMGIAAASGASDVVVGITVRENSATGDQFGVGESARLITKGVIWVVAAEAVSPGSAVYMHVSGGQAGNFGDTSTSNLAIPGATFETTAAAAGDLVKIRLG